MANELKTVDKIFQCGDCIHYKGAQVHPNGYSQLHICVAFPKGIPDKIIFSDFIHTKPYPNDKGIRFEPKGPQ